jgi:hypothetical protein
MRGIGWTALPVIVTAGAQDGSENREKERGAALHAAPLRFSLR